MPDTLPNGTAPRSEAWDQYRDSDARNDPTYELMKRRWAKSDARSVITHARHLMSEPSIVAEVCTTGLPVHVVYGENDDAWPLPMQQQMARDLEAPVSIIAMSGRGTRLHAMRSPARFERPNHLRRSTLLS